MLGKLVISLYGSDKRNMLLVSNTFLANLTEFSLTRGWLVGSTQITNRTVIFTQLEDGVTNLHITPSPLVVNATALSELVTNTGAGCTNIFYKRYSGLGRPIHSVHHSMHRSGDIVCILTTPKPNSKARSIFPRSGLRLPGSNVVVAKERNRYL